MIDIISYGTSLYAGLVAGDYIIRICKCIKKREEEKYLYIYNLSYFLPFPFDIIHDQLRWKLYLRKFKKLTKKVLEALEELNLKIIQDYRYDKLMEVGALPLKRIEELEPR